MTNQDESMIQIQSESERLWQDRDKFNTNAINNRVRKVQQSLIHPESKPTKN